MKDQPTPTDVVVRMATQALVAGATYPLGPAGAVLGAATAVLFDVAAEADRRAWRGLDRMVEKAATDAGVSADELQTWAVASDEHMTFVRDLVSAALTTLDEQRIDALGRVFSETLQDEALLLDRPLILRTLRDLDPVHVVVLRSMLWDDNPQDETVKGVHQGDTTILSAHRWTYAALHSRHPRINGALLVNVLATLERHGLIDKSDGEVYTPVAYAIPVLQYLGESKTPIAGPGGS